MNSSAWRRKILPTIQNDPRKKRSDIKVLTPGEIRNNHERWHNTGVPAKYSKSLPQADNVQICLANSCLSLKTTSTFKRLIHQWKIYRKDTKFLEFLEYTERDPSKYEAQRRRVYTADWAGRRPGNRTPLSSTWDKGLLDTISNILLEVNQTENHLLKPRTDTCPYMLKCYGYRTDWSVKWEWKSPRKN